MADAVAAALGGAPPRTILNGVDTARFVPGDRGAARARLGLPCNGAIVGVAARLEMVKGVDVAIRALAALQCPALLAIAGTGSQQAALAHLAAECGVADRVAFLGHVDAMPDFYAAINVLCLSSRSEGLPLSLLEAQACGIPVVASKVGGVAAAVCPLSGRLVASEDSAGFASAIADAISGGPVNPRAFVQRNGSLAATATAYLDLCDAGRLTADPALHPRIA